MDDKEIVLQLLQGSKNVDRMKKEVVSVINMIIGLAEWNRGGLDKVIQTGSDDCMWSIHITSKKISVECRVRERSGDVKISTNYYDVWTVAYISGWKAEQIPTPLVQGAFEGLHLFVKKMKETFAYLEWKIEPFIKASEVKF